MSYSKIGPEVWFLEILPVVPTLGGAVGDVDGGVTLLITIVGGGRAEPEGAPSGGPKESLAVVAVDEVDGRCSCLETEHNYLLNQLLIKNISIKKSGYCATYIFG